MNILHIVRTSAFSDSKLKNCIQLTQNGDALFLIDDGVYNLVHPLLTSAKTRLSIYALTDHILARGLRIDNTQVINTDMHQLVVLTEQAKKVVTWQ
ncbi:sulfurtransferase complex subunit TusB [Thalassotalea maritima]|uniref:sulfurtransferase complex subunit TusB n=1 Tax=Thalassotalea maritima TaxID=3242416 RepID=UPI0035275484